MTVKDILSGLIERQPTLKNIESSIYDAYEVMRDSYTNGGKLLICGNGGSCADAEHIVGELMKNFSMSRAIPAEVAKTLSEDFGEKGQYMAKKLEGSLPAIALTGHSALSTAFANDVDAELIYAQQVIGYGKPEDVLLGISTSGNAQNAADAMMVAKSKGMKVIGLAGRDGGQFINYCDVLINVKGDSTPQIQELHLPIYHALCQMLESNFFSLD